MIALVLVGIVAFAAEPTTSTEADIHDGRAHGAFFHAGASTARLLDAATPDVDLRVAPISTAIAALVALLLVATSGSAIVVPRIEGDSSVLRWATTARRGPPAHA